MPTDENDLANRVVRLAMPTILRAAREAVVNSSLGTLGAPVATKWVPGTTGGVVAPGDSVSVRLDPDVNSITAQNITGERIQTGRRVMVMLVPPHGSFIAHPIEKVTGSRELLFEQDGDGVTSTWTYSLPQTYRDLEYLFTWSPAVTSGIQVSMRFNGDAGANYGRSIDSRVYGAATVLIDSTTDNRAYISDAYESGRLVIAHGFISNYRVATFKTISLSTHTVDGNAAAYWGSGFWQSNAAITSLTVLAGAAPSTLSRFRIWGLP